MLFSFSWFYFWLNTKSSIILELPAERKWGAAVMVRAVAERWWSPCTPVGRLNGAMWQLKSRGLDSGGQGPGKPGIERSGQEGAQGRGGREQTEGWTLDHFFSTQALGDRRIC